MTARPTTQRLFFAVDLPAEARAAIARLGRDLAPEVRARGRWLGGAGLHVTLHFLGDVPSDSVAPLVELLTAATSGLAPIAVRLTQLVAFPDPRRARVLAVEIADPALELTRLAERLQAGAVALGLRAEERRYRPHVTIARLKSPSDARRWQRRTAALDTSVVLDAVHLYRSELSPEGSRYSALASVVLGAAAPSTAGENPVPDLRAVHEDDQHEHDRDGAIQAPPEFPELQAEPELHGEQRQGDDE